MYIYTYVVNQCKPSSKTIPSRGPARSPSCGPFPRGVFQRIRSRVLTIDGEFTGTLRTAKRCA